MTGSVSRAVRTRNAALAAVSATIKVYQAGGPPVVADTAEVILNGLLDLRVRDDAWARMYPAHVAAHRRMWTDLAAHAAPRLAASPGLAAAPYALLAFTEWQSGDIVAAQQAIGQALLDQPRYSMALLLWQAIAKGIGTPPPPPMTPAEVAAAYDERKHPSRI
jgi:hypothetical protein